MVTRMENSPLIETLGMSSDPEFTPDQDPVYETNKESPLHKKQDDSKEKIIRSALKLFAERGFFETRIPEISAHAKVGVGTMYRHFRNKDHLFNETFRISIQEFSEFLDRSISKNLSPKEQFFDFWKGLGLFSQGKLDQLIMIERNLSSYILDEESTQDAAALKQKISEYFAPAQNDQNLNLLYPSLILGSFTGVLRFHRTQENNIEPFLMEQSAEMLWEGFSKVRQSPTSKKKEKQTKKL
ncbi:transcriptional regulator, TetR family [Leptospira licerasiae serovar Varillal str. VAR 010]|uniref:Transcriptional regulator, TetR family n=2 Tax=Leptospira licerasiae TaxID=447106 RepID=A0ABP2RF75_9LEPT|nr:transcriptional regulator, TetR family [Leptospira licerasiae serovar Varillal str. VAR 010]EJZ43186.1 transcriptional regulator, TetR family [Leptospira licerasiae str. MMD4847]